MFLLFSFLLMLFFASFAGLSITMTALPQPHKPLLVWWVFTNGWLGWPMNRDNNDPTLMSSLASHCLWGGSLMLSLMTTETTTTTTKLHDIVLTSSLLMGWIISAIFWSTNVIPPPPSPPTQPLPTEPPPSMQPPLSPPQPEWAPHKCGYHGDMAHNDNNNRLGRANDGLGHAGSGIDSIA